MSSYIDGTYSRDNAMKYDDLVKTLASRTRMTQKNVRAVLSELPHILRENLKPGDYVVTPLGSIRGVFEDRRAYTLPDGSSSGMTKRKIKVKLRPGNKLVTEEDDKRWQFLTQDLDLD